MPRGGARTGAGRKKGVPSKVTIARQAEVMASGVTPLDVILERMRLHHTIAHDAMGKAKDDPDQVLVALENLEKASEAAKDAAPYVHPRLAAKVPPPEPEKEAGAIIDNDPAAGLSEYDVARRLAFFMERGARGMLNDEPKVT